MIANLLISGRPGVGKTTLIQRTLEQLPGVEVGGFYTSEITQNGVRAGFSIKDFKGKEGLLAHVRLNGSNNRVGKYGVNVKDIDKIAVSAIRGALGKSDVLVIDEIGKMELCSRAFRRAVIQALDSDTPVLGTLQTSGDPFLERIRARPDLQIMAMTERNRDGLRRELLEEVGRMVDHARRGKSRT